LVRLLCVFALARYDQGNYSSSHIITNQINNLRVRFY